MIFIFRLIFFVIKIIFYIYAFPFILLWYLIKFLFSLSHSGHQGHVHNGWVYVLSNPSFEQGILKIGMTTRHDVQVRVNELNRATSTPTNFKIEDKYSCSDPYRLEQYLHKRFAKRRVNQNREFFRVNAQDIRNEIKYLEQKHFK